MKLETIRKIITKKFIEFKNSIKDEKVRDLVSKNSLITGGSIASMLMNEKVNDFDIYFTNRETVLAVSNYYLKIFNEKNHEQGKLIDGYGYKIDKKNFSDEEIEEIGDIDEKRVKIYFKSKGVAKEIGLEDEAEIHELGDTIEVRKDEGEPYRPVYISSNAITLSSDIQIIIRFYGDHKEIHENYDFAHCTNYWLSEDEKLYINQKALECILTKELIYIGSKYPLASLIRIRKFIRRGFNITAGQILKIAMQLGELDLYDTKTLEEQLTGVDLAYFSMLIDAIKNCNEDKLTYNYVSVIIDKIFK
jgi:hypothetical protein